MAFESIAENLEEIETLLAEGMNPSAIARKIGDPKKAQTIRRYKAEVFDIRGAAVEAWEAEKAKPVNERLEAGKARIVDSLELINLAKLRADDLLSLEIGDPYTTAGSEEEKALTLGSCAIYWDTGAKIAVQAIRMEQEIAGDDPENRKADSLLELINAVESRKGSGGSGNG